MKRLMKGVSPILYAGLGTFWLYGGVTKLWSGFDAAPFLHAAVEKAQAQPPAVLSFMGGIVSAVALPGTPFIDLAIPWIEIAAGLGLLVGIVDRRVRRPTLALAGFLSILFLACGASGWNPFPIGAVLLLALSETDRTPVGAAATKRTSSGA